MRDRIDIAARKASYQFDSMAELSRYISDTPKTWRCNDSRDTPAEAEWDLCLGYSKALELARDGWIEGARIAQEALKAMVLKTPAPDTVTDFYGFRPHVPRYCAGAPDSMIRRNREATSGNGRVLTLYVPVNALGHVDAKRMRNFGLGVAQYVNQLETDGVRVELWGVIRSDLNAGYSASGKWEVTHAWRIKRAEQHLDLAVVAFSIGHPAMFRRLGFALRERCASPQDSGYGRSVATKIADLIDAPAGAYVLNGMRDANSVATTPAKALEYIKAQIDKALDEQDAD